MENIVNISKVYTKELKICHTCNQNKSKIKQNFWKDKNSVDGLDANCKKCCIIKMKKAYKNKHLDRQKRADLIRKKKARYSAANARKRAKTLGVIPKWLTNEHKQQIIEIYAKCHELTKTTGIKM